MFWFLEFGFGLKSGWSLITPPTEQVEDRAAGFGFSQLTLPTRLSPPCCRLRAQQSVLGGWWLAFHLETFHPHLLHTMLVLDRWEQDLFALFCHFVCILVCCAHVTMLVRDRCLKCNHVFSLSLLDHKHFVASQKLN